MVNTKLKALKAGLYAIMFLCLVSFVLGIDSYRPYLHNPEVPENPGLKLQGSYQTALWPGAATYSYGIVVPPGRNGLQPELSLSYNSHLTSQRPGITGTAWTLSQNYIWRDVDYSFADASDDKFNLVLNGQSYEFVYVPSEGRYHTKIESFLHITKVSGGSNDEGDYWIVKSKDGTTYRFGYNKDSELVSNIHGYVIRWSLDLVKDTHDNEIYYSYSENPAANDLGAVYPYKIEYNNEKARVVEFVLEGSDRPDKWMVYEQGNKVREARRIKEILVKADGELVRKYALSYTTLDMAAKSFLSSITLFGSDGTSSLPPTTFEYNAVSKGWAEDSRWATPTDIPYRLKKDTGMRLIDLNRDGLVDIAYNNEKAWLNTGSGWAENSAWNAPHQIVDSNQYDTGMRFAELNGDGLTDIVRADGPTDADRDAWINTGSGWSYDAAWHLPTGAHPINEDDDNFDRGRRFDDVNGDGLTDILGNAGSYQSAWINNGNGWTKVDGSWAPPPDAEFVDSLDNPEDQGVRVADVNGDGLHDLMRAEVYHKTWLNTGSGWAQDDAYAVPPQIDFVETSDGQDEGVRLADVNGDGLTDILIGKGNEKAAWINTGSGWVQDENWNVPELAKFTESDGDNKGVRIADVNGDGLPDILKASPERKTWLNKASKPYLLKVVTNEFGGKTTVDYAQSTLIDNTGSDDLSDVGFNMWVVERAVGDNGIAGAQHVLSTTDYSYLDGLYDYGDGEFRGFNSVQEIQPAASITRHWFHQDDALKGMEYRTEVLDSSSLPFKRADFGFTSKAKDGYNVVELSSDEQSLFDGSNIAPKVTRTEYGYDGYGNVLSTDYLGEKDAAGDEKMESWEFVYNTDKWIVNKPSHYALSGPDAKVARQTFYRYDGLPYGSTPVKGDMTWEEQWLDGGANPAVTYKYDDYGNLIEAKNARGFTTSYEFGISDPTSTFGERTVNSAGHAFLYSYDLGTGNLMSETDANGNVRSHSYDVFGRIKKDILPYDTEDYPTKEYAYMLDGTAPEGIKVSQRENSGDSGTLDTYYFYDGFGKLAQHRSEAENSEQAVTNFYYDAHGRLARRSNPYFDPAAAEYALPKTGEANSSYAYDALSRVVRVENPDKTSKSIGFDHWKVTYLDERGNRKTFDVDAYDNILSVTEYVGDNYYATGYAYDPAGNMVHVKDAYGNQISYAYDTIGRKVRQEDPDLGAWEYSYDENGNIAAITDNSGRTVNLEYDWLDRVLKKKSGDDVVKFFYDDVKGTLTKTESSDVSVSYDYDKRLRKIKEMTSIEGRPFVTEWVYDSADRVTKTMLPDDSEISYNYNSRGLLEGISGIVTDVDYNAVSLPFMLSYGNGLVTSYSYNPDNFRIHKIMTSNIQELAYSYDALGNVVVISDDGKGITEAMGYDELNRLTSWNREAGEAKNQLDFEYDALGDIARISSENGGGSSYNYGNSPRHSAAKIVAQAGEPENPEEPSKITIISPVDNAAYDEKGIDLNWTTTEKLVWCSYSLDDGALDTSICPMGDDAPLTKSPSNAENEAPIGTAEWYNPSNATAKDGAYAYVTLSKDNSVKETSVRLVKNGEISGNDKSTNAELPSELTAVSYGSSSDLWGLDLAPSDINSKGFGVAYSAYGSVLTSQYLKATDFGFDIPIDAMINGVAAGIFQYQSGPPFAKMAVVDYIVITVYYTVPRTRNITFQASEGAHSIVIHGTDSSGGQLKSQTVHFKVDTSQVALNIISPVENLTFHEGDLIKLNVVADYNGDGELSYSISNPEFSQDNGIFEWQTGQGDAGVYPVAMTVSDGKVSDTSGINISVKEVGTGITGIFDDFNDGAINDSIWVQNGWTGGTLAESDGALHFETGSSDDRQIRTRVNLAEYGSFNLTFRIKADYVDDNKNVGFWLGNLAEGEPGEGTGHKGYYWQFHGATKGFNIGVRYDDEGAGLHGKNDPPKWEPVKWHSIRIEKTGASMKFFFDGEPVGEDSEFVSSISELYWATGRTWKDQREGESASIYLDDFSVKLSSNDILGEPDEPGITYELIDLAKVSKIIMYNNESRIFGISVEDPDDDALTYTWLFNGTVVSTSQNFSFSPEEKEVSEYNVTVLINDGKSETNASFTLAVVEAPDCQANVDTQPCPLQVGVCTGSVETCSNDGKWLGCTAATYLGYSGKYEAIEASCDGFDNDCNGQADEGFGDVDADGIANCVDSDNDNDGVNDDEDDLIGSGDDVVIIGEGKDVKIEIEEDKDDPDKKSKIVRINNSDKPLVQFWHNFSKGNISLRGVSIEKQGEGSDKGFTAVRGLNLRGSTKQLFVDRLVTGSNAVCIKDQEVSAVTDVTSSCNGNDETSLECDFPTTGPPYGRTCLGGGGGSGGGGGGGAGSSGNSGGGGGGAGNNPEECEPLFCQYIKETGQYEVYGLHRSAVMEQCVDADLDTYLPVGCSGGLDCNDNDGSINPDAAEVCNGADDNCNRQIDEDRVCNHAPVILPLANQTFVEGGSRNFTITVTDDDGDVLLLNATGLPEKAKFSNNTGMFMWQPMFTQQGTYVVSFSVTDWLLTSYAAVNITVADVERLPVNISIVGSNTNVVHVGDSLVFRANLNIDDYPDSDFFWHIGDLNEEADSFTGKTGQTFTYTPGQNEVGLRRVIVYSRYLRDGKFVKGSDVMRILVVDAHASDCSPELEDFMEFNAILAKTGRTWLKYEKQYVQPIVLMRSFTSTGLYPAQARVRNASLKWFEYNVEEWRYGEIFGHHFNMENVSYAVMEAGTYDFGGKQVIAGKTQAGYAPRHVTFSRPFSQPPVIFAEVNSYNNAYPTVVRLQGVTAEGFDLLLQEEEARANRHPVENISYLAIEPGVYPELSGLVVSTVMATDSWTLISFSKTYDNTPVLFTMLQTFNDADTGTVPYRNLNASHAEVKIEEEQSMDAETAHGEEIVGFMAVPDCRK